MIKILSFIFSILFFIYSTSEVHSAGPDTGNWPMFGQNSKITSRSPNSLSPGPLTLVWSKASNGTQGAVVLDKNNAAYRGLSTLSVINSDGTVKCTTGAISTAAPAPAAIADDGTIYQGDRGGILRAFNSDCSSKWTFTASGQIWSSITIGTDGTIYFGSRGAKIYALNPSDGSQKWSYSSSGSIVAGGISLDSNGNLYYGTDTSKVESLTSSGSLRWSISVAGQAAYSAPSISSDDSTIYITTRTTTTFYAINTSNGTIRWSTVIGNGSGNVSSSVAIDQNGNLYTIADNAGVLSYTSNGTLRWTNSSITNALSSSTLENSGNFLYLDALGTEYVLSTSDGSMVSKYVSSSTGSLYQQPAIGSNNYVYYSNNAGNIVAMKPWTLNLSVDNDNPKNGEVINFTVKSSMLKRDPSSSVDNKVQVKLPNGDKVELSYDSATTDSSGNALTVWKGSYTWNLSNGTGNKDIVAEAIAYKTTTSNTTFFNSLPTDFNNTGVSTSLCINSQGEGNCSASSTTSTSTPPGFLSKGDYKLSYNASLDLVNSSPQVIKANNPNTFFDASKSLVILNPSSLSMDSLVMINPLTSTQLTTGDNPDRLKYTLPQSNGFTQTGDFWDLRAYVAYNGAGYTTFQNPITLQLPYDISKLNGSTESSVRIIYMDKLSNSWKILPSSVINYHQKTVAALTKDATIFTVGVIKATASSIPQRTTSVQGAAIQQKKISLNANDSNLKKGLVIDTKGAVLSTPQPSKTTLTHSNSSKFCLAFFCF